MSVYASTRQYSSSGGVPKPCTDGHISMCCLPFWDPDELRRVWRRTWWLQLALRGGPSSRRTLTPCMAKYMRDVVSTRPSTQDANTVLGALQCRSKEVGVTWGVGVGDGARVQVKGGGGDLGRGGG